ncbi:MAG: radical SAM protein [Parvularculaceae bacterium]
MDGAEPGVSPGKFQHPDITAKGEARAHVSFARLDTLWVNTGTLCNIECANCYIDSSPTNDSLAYLTAAEIAPFLDEARVMNAREIGFTGGEPFMNPEMAAMAEAALSRGFDVLILTNAMRPMMRPRVKEGLLSLRQRYDGKLTLRVSLDHFSHEIHDGERGADSFKASLEGLAWLVESGFSLTVAGRNALGASEADMRAGYANLFAQAGVAIDAADPSQLILFPEMDVARDIAEITTACWDILHKNPSEMMCATSRMVVKRKGAMRPVVLSCTLLAYDPQFEMGETLKAAARDVKLNHPFCAQFCVLGGASCSR